ncbi:kelch-like protein 33 [Emydura macquarii macquarii]|uniref:kelch-like protein 33 n=1 Tax=Emydura macquarii macquarii TaxID=1129001 RepID=UPI00352AAB37
MWPGEEEEAPEPEPCWQLCSEGHAERFFQAALELRGQGRLVDVQVRAGARRYQAHGVVLAAVSAFFRQWLARGAAGEVDLSPLATPRGWEAVLDFAYTGAVAATPGTAGELAAAAQALGAPRVVAICRRAAEGQSPAEERWETLRGIEELHRAGLGCDLELTAQGESFRAHRVALSCGCEFFGALFRSGMREARQGAAPRPTLLAPAELRLLLSFAYSGVLAGGWPEVLAAAETALRYQAVGLLELCLDALQRALSPPRCLELLAFARAYDLRALGRAAQAYALAHFARVARCPGFLALPPAEVLALLASDELRLATELEAFEGAVRWLGADPPGRLPHAEAVLAGVRFPLMGTRELRRARALGLPGAPGRLEQLLGAALEGEGPPPCRVRTPPGALVICGGERLAPSLASRRPARALWFAHRFRSGVGLVKDVEWRRLGRFPDGPRFQHAAAVLGSALYVLGGKQYYGAQDTLATAFRYDPAQGSWQRLADMSCARSNFPAVGLAGRLYALGGSSREADCTAGVECYDPRADAWRPCQPLPAPLCGHAGCTLDGAIYVSGGCDASSTCQAWLLRYRPDGPAARLAPMQEGRAGHIMEALGGRLYVAGGLRGGPRGYADQLACEAYDPGPDAWVPLCPLPQAHVGAASAVLQGELLVLGGYSRVSSQNTHLVYGYQPGGGLGVGRWLRLGALPHAYADLRACVLQLPPALRGDPAPPIPGEPPVPPSRPGEPDPLLAPQWEA